MSYQVPEPKFFACSNSRDLAEKIAKSYGTELGNVHISRYSDGEFQPSFEESVRGARVFLIGSTHPNTDNLMEMLLMLDAAKRASARHITAVMPYFGYARQDRRSRSSRVPITARVVSDMIDNVGVDRVVTVDIHAEQIQGFFHISVAVLFDWGKSFENGLDTRKAGTCGSLRAKTFPFQFNSFGRSVTQK